jgi:type II secretory pathway pseudopilin PulG
VIATAFVLLMLATVATLAVRSIGEGDRTQAAVTAGIRAEQARQATEQRRQAAEQDRQGKGFCAAMKGTAEATLTPQSGAVARDLVRTAASAYALVRCDQRTGPLRAGKPDPEAYLPAPATVPNRAPTR